MQKEEQKFQALFENAPIGIIVVNAEGKIILANSFAAKQFGYFHNELTGRTIEELIPQPYTARHAGLRNNFIQHPQTRPMGIGRDLSGMKKDGTNFPVEISLSHYQTEDGTFVIAFISDITVRKQHMDAIEHQHGALQKYAAEIKELNESLEQKVEERTIRLREALQFLERNQKELSQSLKKERELSDLKSRFVSMASHEFRTPLSTILSSAALIEKYQRQEEQDKRNKHVNRIKENVNNLNDILEDFLSLDRLEEGMVLMKQQSVNIPSFLRETISDLTEIKKESQAIEYKHTGNESFVTDEHVMKNILLNLLSNAIKFSPIDGVIEVNTSIKQKEFELQVRDRGIGISEEDQQHLFDRFFRGRNAANIKGTGLGLHIVAKYVDLLHGTIQFKSVLDEGTQFTIHIPQSEILK